MNARFKNILKLLCGSMLAVYLATFCVSLLFVDYKRSRWHAQAATLSRLQPSYTYLTEFADGKVPFDRKLLLEYRLFFTRLLDVIPDRPDAYSMLGFCEYHLGDTKKAIDDYRKAVANAPYFFWSNYNLAVIHYQRQEYGQAVFHLNMAVRSDAESVYQFVTASKVYLDAMTSSAAQGKFEERLNSGFRDSYKMLVLIYYKLKRFNDLIAIADAAVNQKLDDDGFFYYYLGVGAFSAQQFERAALYLREALKRNPYAPEAYYYLAMALKALNSEEMAVAALQKAEILGKVRGPSYENIKNLKLRLF